MLGINITKNILFSPYPLKQALETSQPPLQWAPRLFVGVNGRNVAFTTPLTPPPILRRG